MPHSYKKLDYNRFKSKLSLEYGAWKIAKPIFMLPTYDVIL